MKNLIKNNKGFTLAEVVIAAGVAGLIGLVAVSSLRNTRQASNIIVIGSEVSTLKSLIAAQLARPESCNKTFPPGTPIVRSDVNILNHSGVSVAKKDLIFGPHNEFIITDISTSSEASSNLLKIKVDYKIRSTVDKSGKKDNSFEIDIFVTKNAAADEITGCFADTAGSVRKAIKFSCVGAGAVYDEAAGLYGTCTHPLPEVQNNAGAAVGALCPTGQYLKEFIIQTTPVQKNILKCVPFTVGTCGPWSYLKTINQTTGAADCVRLSDFFTNGQVLSTSSGLTPSYRPINLNCSDSNQVLRRINTNGEPECIPKQIRKTCPIDEYVGNVVMDGSMPDGYTVACKKFTKFAGPCPAGQYLKSVSSDGNIPAGGCAALTLPATCGVNQAMAGIDSNGNAICVTTL